MAWVNNPGPIKGVLLDISGVLRDGDLVIPGSVAAFNRLNASEIPVRLVTNESQVTLSGIFGKLQRMGFNVINHDQIMSPAPKLACYLEEKGYKGVHLLVHPNVEPEFIHVRRSEGNPDAVVIGDAAENFTYENLNNAFRALVSMKERGVEPRLYSLGRGRYYKENGELLMDVGPFCAALEYALDIKAKIFGKPSTSFFQSALASFNNPALHSQEVVMIGDDIIGDVEGAMSMGIRGVLVRTGKFRPEDENHPLVKPDGIVNNLAEAVDLILGKENTNGRV